MRFLNIMLLTLTIGGIAITPAFGQSAGRTALAISATQGDVLNNARTLVMTYCIANRLTLVGWNLTMNLQASIGSSNLNFQQNGTKQIYVDATDQPYSISGQSVVAFRAMNQRFGVSSIRVVYSYVGDGTLHIGPSDANSTVPVTLRTTNSRITSMDLGSGEGDEEDTVSVVR
jgi:hypothetical protein